MTSTTDQRNRFGLTGDPAHHRLMSQMDTVNPDGHGPLAHLSPRVGVSVARPWTQASSPPDLAVQQQQAGHSHRRSGAAQSMLRPHRPYQHGHQVPKHYALPPGWVENTSKEPGPGCGGSDHQLSQAPLHPRANIHQAPICTRGVTRDTAPMGCSEW